MSETADRSSGTPRASGRPRSVVVTALGLTQILAWGSSYYLPAVLAKPIADDTGWPLSSVSGGLSIGLLAAGLVSARVGRRINAAGGRSVLASSSILLAAGLTALAAANGLAVYFAAWIVIGIGMGCGLYDAAFGTLGHLYGSEARRAITSLTLLGGFASTVCWPLSAYLVEQMGWRGACLTYAAVQVGFSLPIHLVVLRREAQVDTVMPAPLVPLAPEVANGSHRGLVRVLACLLTLGALIASMISVHVLTLLQEQGLDLVSAVALGALIGPAQVAARLVEMGVGARHHPIWTMLAATGLMAAGLLVLLAGSPLIAAALILYGAGNGVFSIARGTLPLVLFGAQGYPALMGRLARPALLASALAPSLGALLLDKGGAWLVIAALVAAAAVNVCLALVLWLLCRRGPVPAGTVPPIR